jgi:class 3 adenylate cyclase
VPRRRRPAPGPDRRDRRERYQDFLTRLAAESGIKTPTREALARLDRRRKKTRCRDGKPPRIARPRGSTALSEHLDPEELRDLVRGHHQAYAEVVQKCDGHIAQYLGDGLLVYFGYQSLAESDGVVVTSRPRKRQPRVVPAEEWGEP